MGLVLAGQAEAGRLSMLRDRAGRLFQTNIALDGLLAAAAFVAAISLPVSGLEIESDASAVRLVVLAFVGTVAWPIALDRLGAYTSQRRSSLFHLLSRVGLAGALVGAVIAASEVALRLPVAGHFALVCSAIQVLAIGASRVALFTALRTLRRRGRNTRNVLVVGSGPRARHVDGVIDEHPEWGLRVIGFVDEGDFPFDPRLLKPSFARPSNPRVHKIHEVAELFREKVIDEVVVACPRSMLAAIAPVIAICAAVGVPVTLLSDLFGDVLPPPRLVQFGPHPALSFSVVHHGRVQARVKRAIDAVGAALLLALSAPVLAAAAIAIRMTSPGPILFRQQRCGLYGRRFKMLKLRTMYADSEECRSGLEQLNEMDGPVFKIRNDPRVTPAGRFLRRYSLDEIPQLWNVWRGDMSLVGPRPPIPNEVDQYHVLQRRRLSMRPGLTGLWQVTGRNEIGFADWVRLDLEYIDNWSLALDCQILLRTLPAVLRGTGAS
jgi:exopolysaccharide biosynthesis polyprenyl glycosylphosphotransferase